MKKIFIIIPIILLLICLCLPFVVDFSLAAGYKIEVSIPGGPAAGTEVSLAEYIKYIYLFGLSLIGIAALGVLVYGGFIYMFSDTVVSKDEAKKWIWAAISGLILGLCAYLILNTINTSLISLTPPDLPPLPTLPEPKPPTDCTNDSNACNGCEYCTNSSEKGKKICKNKCTGECEECDEGKGCVSKPDGTECFEYDGGTCKGGKCDPGDMPGCLLKDEYGCITHTSGCCSPYECDYTFDQCIEPKEPDCVKPPGPCVSTTKCCGTSTCQMNICK